MRSVLFALAAIALYAVQNVVLDVKLKQFSTPSLLLAFYFILFPLAAFMFFYQKSTSGGAVLPSGEALTITIVVAVAFFVADFFYISAYTSGGNAFAVAIVATLMPVFVAITKYVWLRETPTPYHVAALFCAIITVTLVTVGDMKKGPVDETVAVSQTPQ